MTNPPVRHFYHCAVLSPRWQAIAAAHADAVAAAGMNVPMTVTLIGPKEDRAFARAWFRASFSQVDDFLEYEEGWEHPTLTLMWWWAKNNPDGLALYGHTKGTHTPTMINDAWRQCMTRIVVGRWRECVGMLRHFNYDLAGTHWMDPGGTPLDPEAPYFCGNFWWARNSYLARLPELVNPENRFEAELWIGKEAPFVYDPDPGAPTEAHCMRWIAR